MYGKCIVFDFDCTLTTRHWYYFLNDLNKFLEMYKNDPVIKGYQKDQLTMFRENILNNNTFDIAILINLFFGGYERIGKLTNLFSALKRYNYDMYISSRGISSQVSNALYKSGLYNYFTMIHTVLDGNLLFIQTGVTEKYLAPKNQFIYNKLFMEYNYRKLIYLDDTNDENLQLLYMLQGVKQSTNEYEYVMFSDREYYYVNGMMKDGSGIMDREIGIIYNIMNYKFGPETIGDVARTTRDVAVITRNVADIVDPFAWGFGRHHKGGGRYKIKYYY